jgi:ferric enterobactin receptor
LHGVRCTDRLRTLLYIAIVVTLPSVALAQCRVEGFARRTDGTPLAGASVRMEGFDLPVSLTTTTTADGHYRFDNVKAGIRVRILVSEGGRTLAVAFPLITQAVETVDIAMAPASSTPAANGELNPGGGLYGDVGGMVRSPDGHAIAGARVTVAGTSLGTTSDSAGRYLFAKLRAGLLLELEASAPNFARATEQVTVPTGGRAHADFSLALVPAVFGAGESLKVFDRSSDMSDFVVRPEHAGSVPSIGRKDLDRVLQLLPGVAASRENSSEFRVRGGAPDQTLVTWDGFTLYPARHLFGAFGGFNVEAIQEAHISKTAFDAADGGRLGGTVRFVGRSSTGSRPNGIVDLNALGAGAVFSTPLGGRSSFLVAARQSFPKSYYDDLIDLAAGGGNPSARSQPARYSGGAFKSTPTSTFDDLNAKLDLGLTGKNRLSLSVYNGREDVNNSRYLQLPGLGSDFGVPASPALPPDALVNASDLEHWTGRGMSAVWTRTWSPAASTTVSIGHSEFTSSLDRASLLTSATSGGDYSFMAGRGGSTGVRTSNRIRDTTARLANSINLGFGHALSIGGDVTAIDVSSGVLIEGLQTANAANPSSALFSLYNEDDSGQVISVYAQDAWRPAAKLVVSPGIRATHYDLVDGTLFEPRVHGTYQLRRRVQLKGGWSIEHQVINQITREDFLHGDETFWALANGSAIPVPRSKQFVVGATVEGEGLILSVEGFYKALDDLTILAPRLALGQKPSAAKNFLYQGSERARGVEFLLQQDRDENSFLASYTLSETNDTYPTLEALTFPASQDQTHEIKVADTVRINEKWSATGALVVSSGRPFTPAWGFEPMWFPTGISLSHVVLGPKNSDRLPLYHRIDISMQRDFVVQGFRGTVGVAVLNVDNMKNVSFRNLEPIGSGLAVHDIMLMARVVNVFLRLRL